MTIIMLLTNKILIVGLGNPGNEFIGTPHNAGFRVIDELIKRLTSDGLRPTADNKTQVEIYKTKIQKTNIVLAKPLTFMNNSGVAVKKILKTYNLQHTTYNLIIVHDDADLPLGNIRISFDSSSGGHKGVEDIIKKIKTKKFFRFRIGIGDIKRPKKRTQKAMNVFVTKKLIGVKKQKLEKSTKLCAEIIIEILKTGEINPRKNIK